MRTKPWYPRYSRDQILLLQEEHRLVALAVWALEDRASLNPEASIPDDPKKLRRWSRLTGKEWGKLSPRILSFFTRLEGKYRCDWLFEDRTKRPKPLKNHDSGRENEAPHGTAPAPSTGTPSSFLELKGLGVEGGRRDRSGGDGSKPDPDLAGEGEPRDPEFPWLTRAFGASLRAGGQLASDRREAFFRRLGRTPEEPPPGWRNRTGKWEQLAPGAK